MTSISAASLRLVQALGTPWGLFRHYWVLFKLVLTAGCGALLLLHAGMIESLAVSARDAAATPSELRAGVAQLAVKAAAALAALLVTTLLSIYKPRGQTAYGQRRSMAASNIGYRNE